MTEWMPISEAPPDVPVELGGYERGYGDGPKIVWRTSVGIALETETNWLGRKRIVTKWQVCDYTHWRPLPSPPATGEPQ